MGNTSALGKGLTGFALVPQRARLLPSPLLRQLRKEPLFLFLRRLLLDRRFAKGRFTGCMWISPSFDLLADTIFLASTKGVVANHFRQQADQEKLEAKDDQENAHEEQRLIVNWLANEKTTNDDEDIHQGPREEGPEAQFTEEPQRGVQERCQEQNRE